MITTAKIIMFAGLMINLLLFGVVPTVAANLDFGGDLTGGIAGGAGYNPSDSGPTALSEKVGYVIRVVLSLVGMIFFALTVYAGILWMTASGNEEQVGKALTILKAALVGLIITLSAYSITYFATTKVLQ